MNFPIINFKKKILDNKRFPLYTFLLTLLAYALFTLSWLFVKKHNFHWDEQTILYPMFGKFWWIYYPDFIYDFYYIAVNIGSFFFVNEDKLQIARIINCLLYPLNSILFYHILKNYFSKGWSLIGVILFSLTPGVFLSSVEIKTESLLLLEFMILSLGMEKFLIATGREKLLYAGFCGLMTALGFTTKFLPLFPILFISTVIYSSKKSRSNLFSRENFEIFGVFLSFFFLTIFITFPSVVENIKNIIGGKFNKNPYFIPGPNCYRSIEEFFSFPYGRYSYAIFSTIPINLGFFNCVFAGLALFRRKVSGKALLLYLPFLILFFLYICNLTLLRHYYYFTLLSPIVILFSLFFWKDFLSFKWQGKKRFLNKLILISVLIYSFFDYPKVSEFYFSYFKIKNGEIPKVVKRKYSKEEQTLNSMLYIFANNSDCNMNCMMRKIQVERPKAIVIYSGLVENHCKYRSTPSYIEVCDYFQKLISEKNGYRQIWKTPFEISSRPWNFDPELKSKFYLLERINLDNT